MQYLKPQEHLSSAVISIAREYIGTAFRHQGRFLKTSRAKGGIDCIGLVAEVSKRLKIESKSGGLLHTYDDTTYSTIGGSKLITGMQKHLVQLDISSRELGSIAVFSLSGVPQHVGFISEFENGKSLIHSYTNGVIEQYLAPPWERRIIAMFKFFGM